MLIHQPFPWLDPVFDRLLAMRDALPHAILLHGPRGIGKSALAEAFGAALLCERPGERGHACGACEACGWLSQDSHPDVRRLSIGEDDPETGEKASREIRIPQVRALAGFLGVGPHRGGRKLVIVEPADALNTPAANALLKTLEEPPGDTVFLLVTGRADGLPATIRSRCVAVGVPMPDPAAASAWLCAEPGVSPSEAPTLLAAAGGAPLRARELADPAKAQVHGTVLEAFSGIPGHSAMRAADAIAAIAPRDWLPVLQAWVSDLGRVLGGAPPRRYPGEAARLGMVARSTTLERVSAFEAWLRRQRPATEHPVNPRLFCEDIVLRYSALFGQGQTAGR